MATRTPNINTFISLLIRRVVQHGPAHFVTWAAYGDWYNWVQVSVQKGDGFYLAIQFPRPAQIDKLDLDRIFDQIGWSHIIVGGRDSLVYYIGLADTLELLDAQVPQIAQRCAQMMRLCWNVVETQDVHLLGARGPSIPLSEARVIPLIEGVA